MRANQIVSKNQEHKRGAALLTLMIIMLLVVGTCGYLAKSAKQEAYAVTRVRDYLKAQAYAEAGVNQAYSLLKANFALRTDPSQFPLTPYGDGTYDVTVTSVGSNKASVSCLGMRGRSTANVLADLQDFGSGTPGSSSTNPVPPAAGAYTYAIVSGGRMGWSGSGTLNASGGKIHANGQYKMTGSKNVIGNISSCANITLTGSTTISGNTTAPAVNASGSAITGTQTIATPPNVAIPDIDLTPYYNQAANNGQVVSGSPYHIMGSSDVVIPGGILWVDGDFQFSGSGNIIGCVIATGNIIFSGSGSQVKVGNYPAFISRDGSIDVSTSGDSHGLIFAKTGGISKSGSGVHTGTMVANGDFDASGSWDLLVYENSTPVPPGGGSGSSTPGSSSGGVGVTAWQK